jgi:hypothetical protein
VQPATVNDLVVMTSDRPDALASCLASYANLRSQHSHERLRLLIMDDSKNPDAGDKNRTVARKFVGAYESVRYIGTPERGRYVELLVSAGADREIAQFCLLGWNQATRTVGASRNAALLECSDEVILMVDDDTLGQIALHPQHEEETIEFTKDPHAYWFYESRQEAIASACWRSSDLFASHGSLLGETLRSLKNRGASTENACDHMIRGAYAKWGRYD